MEQQWLDLQNLKPPKNTSKAENSKAMTHNTKTPNCDHKFLTLNKTSSDRRL